jgi:integrase
MREAQQQLGHKSVKTTETYLRARAGEKVTPTK